MSEEQQDNLSKLQNAIDKLREGIGDLLVQKAAKSLAIVDASEKTYAERKKEKESQLKIWDFFKAYEAALPDAEAVAARRNHLLCKDKPTWEEPKEGEDGELPSLPKDGPLQPLWPMEKDEKTEKNEETQEVKKTETWKRWDPEAGKPFPPSLNVWFSHWMRQALANQGILLKRRSRQAIDVETERHGAQIHFGALTCRNANLLTTMLHIGGLFSHPAAKAPKSPADKAGEDGTIAATSTQDYRILTATGVPYYGFIPQWIGLSDRGTGILTHALLVAQAEACRIVANKFPSNTTLSLWGTQHSRLFSHSDAPYVLLMTEVATMGRRLMQALLGEKHWESANWKRQVRHDPNSKEFVPTEENLEDRQKLHAAELLLVRFEDESIMDLLKKLAAFDDISPKDLRHREASSADEICAAIAKFCPKPNGGRGAYLKSLGEFYVEQDNCEIPLNDIQYRLFCKLHHVKDSPPLLDRAETYIKRMDEVKSLVPTPSEKAHFVAKHKALLQRAARMVRVFLVEGEELTENEKREGFLIPGLGLKLFPYVESKLDTEYRASSLDNGLEENDADQQGGNEEHTEFILADCVETGQQTETKAVFAEAEEKAREDELKEKEDELKEEEGKLKEEEGANEENENVTKKQNADANGVHRIVKLYSWYEFAKKELAKKVFWKLPGVSAEDGGKRSLGLLLSFLGDDNALQEMPEQTRRNLRALLFYLPEAMLDFGALREARLEDLFSAPKTEGPTRSGEAQDSPAESSDDVESDWKNDDERDREEGDSGEILEGSPEDNAHNEPLLLGIKEGKEEEVMLRLLELNNSLKFAVEAKTSVLLYRIIRIYCEDKKKGSTPPEWLLDAVQNLTRQAGVLDSAAGQIQEAIKWLCENALELSEAPKLPFLDVVNERIIDPTGEKELQRLVTELNTPEVRDQFINALQMKETIRNSQREEEQTLYPCFTGKAKAKNVLFERLSKLPRHGLKDAVLDGCVKQYSEWIDAFWSPKNAGILSYKPPKKDKRLFRERMVEFLCELLPQLIVARRAKAKRKPSEGK